MGSWGTQPFENDGALDLKAEWEESSDISVLEAALDVVISSDGESLIDSIDAEAAIASVSIVINESDKLLPEILERLLKKSAAVVGCISDRSELKELWSETEFFGEWLASLTELMQQIVAKLETLTN